MRSTGTGTKLGLVQRRLARSSFTVDFQETRYGYDSSANQVDGQQRKEIL